MEEFDEFDFEIDEEAQKQKERPVFKFIKIVISVFVIVGLLNLFSFRSFFFYRITSPDIRQREVEVKVDAKILQVSLNIIILTTRGEGYGSKRDRESVLSLVTNAGRIWEQGGVELVIKGINFEEIDNTILGNLYQNPRVVIENIKNFDWPDGQAGNESINVLLVGNLGGINGVSFGGLNTVAVADYTTVYDFRALAHEVGHTLGLSHVSESRGQLMYQGANGANLSIEEIEIARSNVELF